MRRFGFSILATLALVAARAEPETRFPNILLVTVDTLRADRVSAYGYRRPTTPNIDRLLAGGVRFAVARTVEPLTTPAMASMLTSRYPHEHGATRNGLRIRPGLPSLPGVLRQRGFRTAAFVGNWPLRDSLSGLGEHFDTFREIVSRKRWLFFEDEATGDDLTAAALGWLSRLRRDSPERPFLLWVHYVEPHAPYRTQQAFVRALGYSERRELTASERYDTEVAFADHAIGELLAGVNRLAPGEQTLVAFAGDHGESLGENGYWGHGRHLYDSGLRIPMGIAWAGRLAVAVVPDAASLLDLAPTILGLIDYPALPRPRGVDWTRVLRGQASPPRRSLYFQAHRGAVQRFEDLRRARLRGLLEVGLLRGTRQEILRLRAGERMLFDVAADPAERRDLASHASPPSAELVRWRSLVEAGLAAADELPSPSVDGETEERLRALGYTD